MEQKMKLVFHSSVDNLTPVNESFDCGKLRVAYHGRNRNGSDISKSTFERFASTMYNKPVVANYERECDEIGGHDVSIVKCDGGAKMVNLTQPVGVVPESAKYSWEMVEEKDGTFREYFCTDVLVWKRQEAYEYIKNHNIVAQSMEIAINSSHQDNGFTVVDDFEFLAFCLLGSDIEPCFESASLALFDNVAFTEQLHAMLADVPCATRKYLRGVTNELLNEKLKLMESYGLTIDDLDFELAEFELEDLKGMFENIKPRTPVDDSDDDPDTVDEESEDSEEGPEDDQEENEDGEDNDNGEFSLNNSDFQAELERCVCKKKEKNSRGDEVSRYIVIDFNTELKMVYCIDTIDDWAIVGIPFTTNGDFIEVDFGRVKKMKTKYVEYEDGEECAPSMVSVAVYDVLNEMKSTFASKEEAYKNEIRSLEEFKRNVELDVANREREEVFSRFPELENDPTFIELKCNCGNMDAAQVEEKCFAIRGRIANFSFSKNERDIRLPVDNAHFVDLEEMPYGGAVERLLRK